MGDVYLTLSMSLDGYIAGPGDDVEALHRWLFDGDSPSPHGHGLRLTPTSREVIDETFDATGATVAGRRTHEVSGGWGGRTPFPMPYFIVSHDVPDDMARDDAPFTFVTEGVEAAIARAKEAAGDKKVNVMGADVPQQAIRRRDPCRPWSRSSRFAPAPGSRPSASCRLTASPSPTPA